MVWCLVYQIGMSNLKMPFVDKPFKSNMLYLLSNAKIRFGMNLYVNYTGVQLFYIYVLRFDGLIFFLKLKQIISVQKFQPMILNFRKIIDIKLFIVNLLVWRTKKKWMLVILLAEKGRRFHQFKPSGKEGQTRQLHR